MIIEKEPTEKEQQTFPSFSDETAELLDFAGRLPKDGNATYEIKEKIVDLGAEDLMSSLDTTKGSLTGLQESVSTLLEQFQVPSESNTEDATQDETVVAPQPTLPGPTTETEVISSEPITIDLSDERPQVKTEFYPVVTEKTIENNLVETHTEKIFVTKHKVSTNVIEKEIVSPEVETSAPEIFQDSTIEATEEAVLPETEIQPEILERDEPALPIIQEQPEVTLPETVQLNEVSDEALPQVYEAPTEVPLPETPVTPTETTQVVEEPIEVPPEVVSTEERLEQDIPQTEIENQSSSQDPPTKIRSKIEGRRLDENELVDLFMETLGELPEEAEETTELQQAFLNGAIQGVYYDGYR
jgi:hypothetical protein